MPAVSELHPFSITAAHSPRRFAVPLVAASILAFAAAGCADTPDGPPPPTPLENAATTITPDRIEATIRDLADDSTRGRANGSPELEKVAAYLAAAFQDAGLDPAGTEGFGQPFTFIPLNLDTAATALSYPGTGEVPLHVGTDLAVFPPAVDDTTGPLVWGGAIRRRPPGRGVDITGAIVLLDHPRTVIDQAWVDEITQAYWSGLAVNAAGYGVVLPPEVSSAQLAAAEHAIGGQHWFYYPVFVVTDSAARGLVAAAGADLDSLRAGDPDTIASAFRVQAPLVATFDTISNVMGVVEGSDPDLKDTYVVLTAHYDNLGVQFPDSTGDDIYNGADSNASGTAGILEVARALAGLETRPRRSVLFIATGGGLESSQGTQWFLDHPTVPLDQIVAEINLDMISRNSFTSVNAIGKDYTTMGAALDTLGQLASMIPEDDSPNGDVFLWGSDQGYFARAGIPALYFWSGSEPDRGTPSDEVDRINADKAARVARLAFYLTYAVANDTATVRWTGEGQLVVQGVITGN